jgi:hypothetical protein
VGVNTARRLWSPSSESIFWLVVVGVILLYTIGLSIGPRVKGSELEATTPTGERVYHVAAIDLPGPFGILLSRDSPELMESAARPEKMVEPGNRLQSRPALMWLAWVVSKPISLFTSGLVALTSHEDVKLPEGRTRTREQAMGQLAPVFVAFYLINVAFLAVSVWLLRRAALLSGVNPDVACLAGALVIFSSITKAYLISPHTQFMNIVLPVLVAAILFRWFAVGKLRLAFALGVSALTGLGILAYATWLLMPFVLLMGVGWAWWAGGDQWKSARRIVAWSPLLVGLMLAPYVLWYAYVMNVTGSFYVHEAAKDGGLVWILQGSAADAVVRLAGNLAHLVSAAAVQAVPYVLFVVPAAVAMLRNHLKLPQPSVRTLMQAVLAAALTSAVFLMFFGLLGFRIWRYAVPLLPAWILPIGLLNAMVFKALAPGAERRVFVLSLAALAIGFAVFFVAKDGPWS